LEHPSALLGAGEEDIYDLGEGLEVLTEIADDMTDASYLYDFGIAPVDMI
jgi:hypothetical protein